MKLVKMSLAAAVLLGASAFAIDNVKVNGDAKLYYSTNNAEATNGVGNAGTTGNLFDKGNSAADIAVRVGVTGDLMKNVSFGLTGYTVTTLGLENNLVSNTWTGAHGPVAGNGSSIGGEVSDRAWMGEAWMAGTAGKTTVKAGRMELDTPLAFSEKWSVVPNTFQGVVVINQDIPDTTLIGAWVGSGNGANALGYNSLGLGGVDNNSSGVGTDGIMGTGASFHTFANDGAYAAAAINNSLKFLTAQAWYYNVVNVADAYWLQADWDCQLIKNVKVGVQYADLSPKGVLAGVKDSSAYAAKLAYVGIDKLNLSVAYSSADEDGTLKVANVATNNLSGAQSKLYTEAYWNYGYVGAAGADTYNVTAEYDAGIAKVGAYVTNVSAKKAGNTVSDSMNEVALTVSKSIGALDATLAYVSTDTNAGSGVAANDSIAVQNGGKRYDALYAMLQLNF
jgi:hypothetical protein